MDEEEFDEKALAARRELEKMKDAVRRVDLLPESDDTQAVSFVAARRLIGYFKTLAKEFNESEYTPAQTQVLDVIDEFDEVEPPSVNEDESAFSSPIGGPLEAEYEVDEFLERVEGSVHALQEDKEAIVRANLGEAVCKFFDGVIDACKSLLQSVAAKFGISSAEPTSDDLLHDAEQSLDALRAPDEETPGEGPDAAPDEALGEGLKRP